MLCTQKEIQSIPKQMLIMLIFNKHASRAVANTKKCNTPKKQNNESSEQFDFDDYIKWCYGKRHRCNTQTLEKLSNGDILENIRPDNFKLFIMAISGASYHRLSQPNYYDILIRNKCMYPQHYFTTIQKDVNRTLSKQSLQLESLRRVLSSYAIRNPYLLYCQGLNMVVGNLLVSGFSEAQSFWLLVCFIQDILPYDYYVNLRPIVCLNSILNDLIRSQIPDFMKLCQNVCLETSFFFVSWAVTLYGKGFTRPLSNHFLALIVLQKQVALVKIALVLVKLIYPKIEQSQQFGTILKDIQLLQNSILVSDFKKQYDKIYIDRQVFRILFNQYLEAYPQQQLKSMTRKINIKKKTLLQCNEEYEICLHVVQIQKQYRNLRQFQAIKIKTPLDSLIDQTHFDQNHVKRRKSKPFLKTQFLQQVKVGRHRHICSSEVRSRGKQLSIFMYQQGNERQQDFENINEGQVKKRNMSLTTSQLYQQISSQFQVIQIPSQEFEQLQDPQEQLKQQQQIIRSLSKRKIDIRIKATAAGRFLGGLVKNLFGKDKKKD